MKGLATEHRGIIHRHRQQYSYEQRDGERGSGWGRIGGVDVTYVIMSTIKKWSYFTMFLT